MGSVPLARRGLPAILAAAALLGGCGSGGHSRGAALSTTSPRTATRPARPRGPTATIPAPSPTGIAASRAAVHVIRGWSDALRRGDVRGAARYFAIPSEMVNGSSAGQVSIVRIRTTAEALVANETLPCGARFLSADRRGRFVNALFRLTGRPGPGGSACAPGRGATARTNFVISAGRIVEWVRAPDEPGDNGSPAGPQSPESTGPIA
jgi:hypothetical protein